MRGRVRRSAIRALRHRVILAACIVCTACATRVESPHACRSGHPACPVPILSGAGSNGTVADLRGALTPAEPSVSYSFATGSASRLEWSLEGVAAHVVLTSPDGSVDGPGLPRSIALDAPGTYVLSLSANTMAEAAYGPFRLAVRLVPR